MPAPTRRLIAAAPLLLLTGLAGPAVGQARKVVPARRLFPFLDRYLQIPTAQRSRFRLAYHLSRDGNPAAGVRGWYVHGGARAPITVAADGRVSPLPTLAQWREAEVEFDVPADTPMGMNMSLEATVAPAARMEAAPLAEAVEQARAAIRRAAGVMGFAAPRMAAVTLRDAGSARVVLAGGREAGLPLAGGHPRFEPGAHRGAEAIVCGRAPTRLLIGPAS